MRAPTLRVGLASNITASQSEVTVAKLVTFFGKAEVLAPLLSLYQAIRVCDRMIGGTRQVWPYVPVWGTCSYGAALHHTMLRCSSLAVGGDVPDFLSVTHHAVFSALAIVNLRAGVDCVDLQGFLANPKDEAGKVDQCSNPSQWHAHQRPT